jgi:serine/threonine protein kinase
VDIAGRTLSHYRVVEKLGQGASGLVYLAEDLVLGRPVVLKLLPPDASDDARRRALVEARTIAALNHPNICTLYEYEEAEGEQFLVLEVLEGQTLESLVAQGPIPVALVVDLGIQLADALDAAHSAGIVHRDIKPPNVFVTFRGQAKILDFGIATLSSPGASRETGGPASSASRSLYGTLHYIAPELIRGEASDARSDIFSLGAVLYELATGVRAFDGAEPPDVAAAVLGGPPRPIRDVLPELPAELERIIGRTLEKQPDFRCQSAADLRADLQRLKKQLEAPSPRSAFETEPSVADEATAVPDAAPWVAELGAPASAADPPDADGRVSRWAIAAAAILTAAAIGVPMWMVQSHRADTKTAELRTPTPAPSDVPPPPSLTPAPQAAPTVWLDPPSDVPDTRPPEPTPTPAAAPAGVAVTYESELQAARAAIGARRFDEASSILKDVSTKAGDTVPGIESQIQLGHVQARQRQIDEAVAAYAAVVARYPEHPKAAEAMYYQAQSLLETRRPHRDSEARKLLTEIYDRFPGHVFVARALLARGEIESRKQSYLYDAVLGKAVPAWLVTYRTLAGLDRVGREREHALWRLGQAYERVERFDLAARTYRELGEGYRNTHYDAWASAGRLYDRRLNDPDQARAAYQRVPASSPAFKDAQKYVNRSAS